MGASSAMYIYARFVVLMHFIREGRLDTLRAKSTPVSHYVTGGGRTDRDLFYHVSPKFYNNISY
jgi:hypothetical protein